MIWQGKWRPIDDGRKARTNSLATVRETTVSVPPEFLVLLLRVMTAALVNTANEIPKWFQPRVSLEDWWKGYRQVFATARHLGLAVVAVMCPSSGRWFYTPLKGLPFGLGVAVNQFARIAAFLTAMG